MKVNDMITSKLFSLESSIFHTSIEQSKNTDVPITIHSTCESWKKFFLSIEIDDDKLKELIRATSKFARTKKLHITVQATDQPISESDQHALQELKFEPIVINGATVFEGEQAENSYCVLKVDVPQLHKFWKQDDFPIHKHGYNSHITIYHGDIEDCNKMQQLFKEFTYTISPDKIDVMFEINTETFTVRRL